MQWTAQQVSASYDAICRHHGLCVRQVYYPPYHSKYNAIERYWAGLEQA